MPQLDKTGPQGAGPMTGRGMGCCGGGMGFGGRGCRRGYFSLTGKERKEMLEEQVKYLKEDLEVMEKEIKSLEK